MLQKTTSIVIVLALSTLVLPTGASDEIEEAEYATALGVREGVTGEDLGIGIGISPDPKACGHCSGVGPVGAVYLSPDLPYDHVDVYVDDAVFEQAAAHVCLLDPYGDFRCDDDDHSMGMGCGARAIRDVPVVADTVLVFLYSVYVGPSLDVCLTSTGTVRGMFS